MSFANCDHRSQDVIPRLGFHHDFIGEHAAIPAQVAAGLGQLPILLTQPVTGHFDNINLPIWIIGQTVTSGLVMRTRTLDGGIVLGNVKVDSPWPQS